MWQVCGITGVSVSVFGLRSSSVFLFAYLLGVVTGLGGLEPGLLLGFRESCTMCAVPLALSGVLNSVQSMWHLVRVIFVKCFLNYLPDLRHRIVYWL
jgi:hypothetical protein